MSNRNTHHEQNVRTLACSTFISIEFSVPTTIADIPASPLVYSCTSSHGSFDRHYQWPRLDDLGRAIVCIDHQCATRWHASNKYRCSLEGQRLRE
jgi:hypothetical protein